MRRDLIGLSLHQGPLDVMLRSLGDTILILITYETQLNAFS